MGFEQMQSYFGFTRLPFDRRIAPSALYRSASHQEARARIQFLISQGALGLICGDVGAGKTCAARAAVAGLDHSRHTIIYLANPAVGTRGIYCQIVCALGGEPHHYKANLIAQACELLERERTERAKQVVLLLDEAHLLSPAQLEELRLLTNAEMDSQSPFAGILLGQPTLRKRLRMGSFAALDQRIALRYELPGMTEQESGEYVRHHVQLTGRKDNLFSDDALELLHRSSRGIPRQLNNLATQALIACYAAQNAIVDLSCAQAAVAEMQAE
ncbi:MAG: AAA family ATPase [Solirubrobacteraceae bacterium]|jgi:type II secretory pathway predicted ATPase ExeA